MLLPHRVSLSPPRFSPPLSLSLTSHLLLNRSRRIAVSSFSQTTHSSVPLSPPYVTLNVDKDSTLSSLSCLILNTRDCKTKAHLSEELKQLWKNRAIPLRRAKEKLSEDEVRAFG